MPTNGNQIWRSSELKNKVMDQEIQRSDIQLVLALAQKTGNVQIYSSREQQMKEDRQYGYERQSQYLKMTKDFYQLNSKVKLVRAFEQMWMISNNISQDKNFIYTYTKTNWLLQVENILQKAFDVQATLKKHNVLIHCPTGDDGSCVLSSVA